MSENSDLPPAVADQNNIGGQPHGVAEAKDEKLTGEEEKRVILVDIRSKFERRVGIVKDIVQTLGILASGKFAIWKFGVLDKPTLERHLEVSGPPLNWLRHPNFCIASMDVKVNNMRKSYRIKREDDAVGAHARESAAAIPVISLAFLTTWGQRRVRAAERLIIGNRGRESLTARGFLAFSRSCK